MKSGLLRKNFQFLILTWLLGASAAQAGGNFGPELEEFYKHLDDYQAEVVTLIEETEAIVAAYPNADSVKPMVDALLERWEEVGLHGAIETRAPILYPTVWRALLGLIQATEGDMPAEQVAASADEVAAALWQGLGGVRLAAYQVQQDPDAVDAVAETPPDGDRGEQIARIKEELQQAAAAYADGNLARAETLIHDAYMKRFEYLEGDLIGQDAELVEKLELDFNARLPQLMEQGAEQAEIQARLSEMFADLDRAAELLAQAEAERPEVF